MKIRELIDAVHIMLHKVMNAAPNSTYRPKICVYVTDDYMHEAMCEIHKRRSVSGEAYEFYTHRTIMSFPVYVAHTIPGVSYTHPSFRVVNLDNSQLLR